MASCSSLSESNILFKIFNIKSMSIVLIAISSISTNKIVISSIKILITPFINKVEFSQIINKDISSGIWNSLKFSTFIIRLSRKIFLGCCMCNNFCSLGTSLFSSCSTIMIAFYPKSKVPSSSNHSIKCLFIILKFFKIIDITSNGTAAKHAY